MDVIDIATRRTARPALTPGASSDGDLQVCHCGSSWFQLVDRDVDGSPMVPSVVVDQAGRITGYTGTLRCIECGQAKTP